MRTPAFAGFNIANNSKSCGMFECRIDEANSLIRVGSAYYFWDWIQGMHREYPIAGFGGSINTGNLN